MTVTQMTDETKVQVRGHSGRVWELTLDRKQRHVYCSCPAWRFQSAPPEERTCKHIRAFERLPISTNLEGVLDLDC